MLIKPPLDVGNDLVMNVNGEPAAAYIISIGKEWVIIAFLPGLIVRIRHDEAREARNRFEERWSTVLL